MADEDVQAELARLQVYLFPAAAHRAREQVHLQIIHFQGRFKRGAARPASQCGDSRRKLGKRKRLDEIVIAPGLESIHPIVDAAERRQKQHRRGNARGGDN